MLGCVAHASCINLHCSANLQQALAFRHLEVEVTLVRADFFREAVLEMMEASWHCIESKLESKQISDQAAVNAVRKVRQFNSFS